MIGHLAALMLLAQPTPAPVAVGRNVWVFATIGHSEWCPAGNVRIDLVSGTYDLTPRASQRVCQNLGLDRRMIRGRLDAKTLTALRAAFVRSTSDGLVSQVCRQGGTPDVIISNAGTPVLLATDGRATRSAPQALGCWSEAANALHDLIDETFQSRHDR